MFEIGKDYDFVTLGITEDGLCENCRTCKVLEIDGTLLLLRVEAMTERRIVRFRGLIPEKTMVLNTASAFFHSATLKEPE